MVHSLDELYPTYAAAVDSAGQVPLGGQDRRTADDDDDASPVIFCSPDTVVAAVPSGAAHHLDAHLPPFWRARPIPAAPVAAAPAPPADTTARFRALLAKLEFDPVVAETLEALDVD
jgi:hypothetical protein